MPDMTARPAAADAEAPTSSPQQRQGRDTRHTLRSWSSFMLLGAGAGAPLPLPDAAAWPLPASAPGAATDTHEGGRGAASFPRFRSRLARSLRDSIAPWERRYGDRGSRRWCG